MKKPAIFLGFICVIFCFSYLVSNLLAAADSNSEGNEIGYTYSTQIIPEKSFLESLFPLSTTITTTYNNTYNAPGGNYSNSHTSFNSSQSFNSFMDRNPSQFNGGSGAGGVSSSSLIESKSRKAGSTVRLSYESSFSNQGIISLFNQGHKRRVESRGQNANEIGAFGARVGGESFEVLSPGPDPSLEPIPLDQEVYLLFIGCLLIAGIKLRKKLNKSPSVKTN